MNYDSFRLTRRAFLGAVAASSASGPLLARSEPEPFDVALRSNVRVRARDGVHLATDVYLPARGGKVVPGRYPTLIERTPYGRNMPLHRDFTAASSEVRSRAEVAAGFVRHGYAVVFQDVRGRYDSEGAFVKYLLDAADGFDTCAWIVAQDWSDKQIGSMGLSYAAHTQVAMACLNPPGLKAMYVDCGGFSNAYQDGIRQGGAFELKQVTWAHSFGLKSPQVEADPALKAQMQAINLRAWFARMPWKRGHSPLSAVPEYEDYVYDQWEHGRFDAFWKQVGIYAEGYYDRFPDAAMVHMSGWYDPYSKTATDNYAALSRRSHRPVRLIMGPWTHGARSTTFAGDVEFGPGATLDADTGMDFFEYRRRWFDRTLKRIDVGATEPAVRIFVMGGGTGAKSAAGRLIHGGRWRSENDWPLLDRRETAFYLHADGALATAKPTAAGGLLTYRFDPQHPVPTIGGAVTSGEPLFFGGGFDQHEAPGVFGTAAPYLPLEARPDVLVFQTAPLEADVEVTGAIEAKMWIHSDAPDTDFTIKLIDVYPPSVDYPQGYALNLTDGILRCRYRDSWENPELMTPGKSYPITVRAFPTSNLFKRGHRIRLDVSSSNFPRFDVNPNTGGAEGGTLDWQVAHNSVHVDPERPSHVVLPIIPRRA
jgi:hypothetical protein